MHKIHFVRYFWLFYRLLNYFLLACPVRRGQMLNVRGEKVSEALFLAALKKAVAQWPAAQLVDYCCAESGIMGETSQLCHSVIAEFVISHLSA